MKWDSRSSADILQTDEHSGTVLLNGRRVVLFEAEIFRRLQKRLIEVHGVLEASKMSWNFSFATGYQDAVIAKRGISSADTSGWFEAGTDMLAFRGFARVDTVNGSLDESDPVAELVGVAWRNSWEIENNESAVGCATIVGYLSGFATAVTGKTVLFIETECEGRGDARCFGVAKHEWRADDEIVKKIEESARDISREPFNFKDSITENLPSIERIQLLTDQLEEQRGKIEQLQSRVEYLQDFQSVDRPLNELIGQSPGYKKAVRNALKVASTDSTVLIQGETGTGKELFARFIHANSLRKERPLIIVNCAALPVALIESELFGHEKGSFTGAVGRKLGRFELADGGTIFLDEIGELPPETQSKFLRVLQEGEFERVGGNATIKANVRVVAATNRDLGSQVESGEFRADLFYRLNVFPITVPPLRTRRGDIDELVNFFAQKYRDRFHKQITSVSRSSMDRLKLYDFPGNIRELQHLVERSVLLSEGEVLEIVLPVKIAQDGPESGVTNKIFTLAEAEKQHILTVLARTNGAIAGKGGAAEILDLPPSTLRSRMKKLGIN